MRLPRTIGSVRRRTASHPHSAAPPCSRSYDEDGEQLSRALAAATTSGQGWHGATELSMATHFTCRYGKPAMAAATEYANCRNGVGEAFAVARSASSAWERGNFTLANDKTSTRATTCGSLAKWRPMSRCDRILTWVGATGATVTSQYYSSAMLMPKSDHNAVLGAFELSVPSPTGTLRFARAAEPSDETDGGKPSTVSSDGISDNDDSHDDSDN